MAVEQLPYLNNLLELITLIIGLICYSKFKESSEKRFIMFLFITFCVDTIGSPIISEVLGFSFTSVQNYVLYNSYMLFYFFFILFWFRTIIKNALSKKVISVLLLTIIVIMVLNTSLQGFTYEYASHTFIIGTLFTASAATIYFVQILRSNDILHIKHNLSFWITSGILVFNIGMIPIIAFQKYVSLAKGGSYFILLFALNLIFYSCISLGFIWSKQK